MASGGSGHHSVGGVVSGNECGDGHVWQNFLQSIQAQEDMTGRKLPHNPQGPACLYQPHSPERFHKLPKQCRQDQEFKHARFQIASIRPHKYG